MYGIFTYIWLIYMVNVGIYISYMDPMGIGDYTTHVQWGLIIINHEMRICFLNNQDSIWKVGYPGFFSWLKWRLL